MKFKSAYKRNFLFTLSFGSSSSFSSSSSFAFIHRHSSPVMTYSKHSSPGCILHASPSSSSSSIKDPFLPTMIVFDLDDCLWSPEMYTLNDTPSMPIHGKLNPDSSHPEEVGVLGMGVPPQGTPIVKLFDDARRVLRLLIQDETFQHVIIAAASSSEEPTFSYSCLRGIDIIPGVRMIDLFQYHEIGRTGHLSSRKTTHFRALHEKSGVPFQEMLFFDDCNWGDHCTDVTTSFGVVSQRTPNGLKLSEFHAALEKYKKAAELRLMQRN